MKKIELRKVSYVASMSEETHCYSAQVWVDGEHVCDVSNRGHGGCDEQHAARGKTYADVAALNDYIKSTHAPRDTGMMLEGKPFIVQPDLEYVCGELLTEWMLARDLKRILKRTVAFIDPANGHLMTYKGKVEGVQRAHVITETLRKKPGAVVLNNLPFDEALVAFKKTAEAA